MQPRRPRPRPPPPRKVRSARRGSFFRLHALDAAYAREMMLPMTLGLIVLVLVMAGNFVYWAINSIVNQGITVAPIIKLFFLALPGFAVLGIPVGVILAVCLVLNRAVRDNEILALRVGGASMPRVVMPFLFMALLASGVDYYVVEKVAPVTNERATKLTATVMSQNTAPLVETDRYFRAGPYYFYVGSVSQRHFAKRDDLSAAGNQILDVRADDFPDGFNRANRARKSQTQRPVDSGKRHTHSL